MGNYYRLLLIINRRVLLQTELSSFFREEQTVLYLVLKYTRIQSLIDSLVADGSCSYPLDDTFEKGRHEFQNAYYVDILPFFTLAIGRALNSFST